jgi:TolB-like protein/Flp pilus assembly protein TadD
MSFFAELKRRHVYRVAVLYIIISWLVLQVADVFMSFLPLPAWTSNLIFLLLVLGFPLALFFAWAFELTPEGIKRDQPSATEVPRDTASRKKLDILIFGAMVIALGYFAFTHNWQGEPAPEETAEIRSIVVLPLDNLMNDPEQAFFVDGMHEALITELSKVAALRVISRTSALHYRDSGKAIPEIAQELAVDAIIEGSVLRSGNTIRVTAQLIEGRSDRHLWADNFDYELNDILALYGRVTREIVDQIKIKVTAEEEANLATTRPVRPDVYELYLKGNYLCHYWSKEDMQRGTELLQKAIGLDPQYAPPYATLARCLQYQAFMDYVLPLDVVDRAHAAFEMALQLDGNLAEAHLARAGVLYYLEFQVKEARQALEKALELDPASAQALVHASWLAGETGRFEEALDYSLRAIEIDPFSVAAHQAMGEQYYLARKYDLSITAMENGMEVSRNDPSMKHYASWPYEQKGMYEKAIELNQAAVDLSNRAPIFLSGLGYSYGLAGKHEQARQVLEELQQAESSLPYHLAVVYLGLGEYEQAIDWLEKAFEARSGYMAYLDQGPKFDPLRNNQRFINLLQRFKR